MGQSTGRYSCNACRCELETSSPMWQNNKNPKGQRKKNQIYTKRIGHDPIKFSTVERNLIHIILSDCWFSAFICSNLFICWCRPAHIQTQITVRSERREVVLATPFVMVSAFDLCHNVERGTRRRHMNLIWIQFFCFYGKRKSTSVSNDTYSPCCFRDANAE